MKRLNTLIAALALSSSACMQEPLPAKKPCSFLCPPDELHRTTEKIIAREQFVSGTGRIRSVKATLDQRTDSISFATEYMCTFARDTTTNTWTAVDSSLYAPVPRILYKNTVPDTVLAPYRLERESFLDQTHCSDILANRDLNFAAQRWPRERIFTSIRQYSVRNQ